MALNTVIISLALSNSGSFFAKSNPLLILTVTGPCLACHAFFSGNKTSNQSVPISGNSSLARQDEKAHSRSAIDKSVG